METLARSEVTKIQTIMFKVSKMLLKEVSYHGCIYVIKTVL